MLCQRYFCAGVSAVLLFLFLSFTGCKPQNPPSSSSSAYQVTDDLGHTIAPQHPPRRIVSLAPNLTETLFALGSGDKVVGVTEYCDYPPEAQRLPVVGGLTDPNLERILELRPDLVVMSGSGNMRSDYERLTSAGIPVFVSKTKSLGTILSLITRLGVLTDCTAAADSILEGITETRDSIAATVFQNPPPRVLLLVSIRPLIAAGPGTYLDELISLCNGENIAPHTTAAYPIMNREEVLRQDPDIILMTSDIAPNNNDMTTEYSEWESLSAVRTGMIDALNADIISRPGPRVGRALRLIARSLHPPLQRDRSK